MGHCVHWYRPGGSAKTCPVGLGGTLWSPAAALSTVEAPRTRFYLHTRSSHVAACVIRRTVVRPHDQCLAEATRRDGASNGCRSARRATRSCARHMSDSSADSNPTTHHTRDGSLCAEPRGQGAQAASMQTNDSVCINRRGVVPSTTASRGATASRSPLPPHWARPRGATDY